MSARPLVSDHIEISGSGQTEDDVLCLAGFLTLHSFVDGNLDCVAALWSWKDTFDSRELLSGLEDFCLLHASGSTAMIS